MIKLKGSINKVLARGKKLIKFRKKDNQNNRIEKIMASVHASMAVEGLKPSKVTIALGKQYLEGEISEQEVIAKIKSKYIPIKPTTLRLLDE